MGIKFTISKNIKKVKINIPADGKEETLSRSAINVLRGERDGYLIYANSELFSVCATSNQLIVEFLRKISKNEFDEYNNFLKNNNIDKYYVWDLHNNIQHNLFKIEEEVHLMETLTERNIESNDILKQFRVTLFNLKKIYSESFNVPHKKILNLWINELKNEDWFSEDNVFIVGDKIPTAFMILRKRNAEIIEIFMFGITNDFKNKNLSADIFMHLIFLINKKFNFNKLRIQVWVHKSNKIAYRLYAKHNFKSIRIRKKYLVNL